MGQNPRLGLPLGELTNRPTTLLVGVHSGEAEGSFVARVYI